jgi:hypothetical protein
LLEKPIDPSLRDIFRTAIAKAIPDQEALAPPTPAHTIVIDGNYNVVLFGGSVQIRESA